MPVKQHHLCSTAFNTQCVQQISHVALDRCTMISHFMQLLACYRLCTVHTVSDYNMNYTKHIRNWTSIAHFITQSLTANKTSICLKINSAIFFRHIFLATKLMKMLQSSDSTKNWQLLAADLSAPLLLASMQLFNSRIHTDHPLSQTALID